MDSKRLARVEIKDAAKGEVEAVFATLDVIDKDGDVTNKGAFSEGAPVSISAFGHKSWEGQLPVGKGTIHEVGNEAVFKGRFFLNTTGGRDTFEVVKEMAEENGPGMEWSYGFHVEDSERGEREGKSVRFLKQLKVMEVSPVMEGAGVGTRVTGIKDAADYDAWLKRTFSAEQRRAMSDNGKAMPDGSFPISTEEDLHNAIRAIGRAKNPAAARRHIMSRARAMGHGDLIPDDWKSFNADIEYATDVVSEIRKGAERVVALRAEKGKNLSNINMDSLGGLREELRKLDAILDSKDDNTSEDDTEMTQIELALIEEELDS